MYRSLDPEKIVATVEQLHRRIAERFPESGLSGVCGELLKVARESQERAAWIGKPQRVLRAAVGVVIVLVVVGLVFILSHLRLPTGGFDVVGFIQASEAGVNLLVVLGASLLFLVTVETRIKRSRAIKAMHELRALAHVIDMHQLTKDPERVTGGVVAETPSSPKRSLTPFELERYLDYCTEMLSVAGKIAALYVQKFDDPVVLDAAEDVEALTTGLSRKIWQKIMILNPVGPQASDRPAK
ncbi:MAG TPA: hypothetical protein VFS10_20975 [Pyrinomonadaceae bacterium]|nr:hypothetical protein [Pyrinomonadaceae bacterium]